MPERRRDITATTSVRAHGAEIPILGFGTWALTGSDARRMVEAALGIGYRHVDTAQIYDNEEQVGQALAAAGVPRDEVWLTTKVWPDHYRRERFADSVRRSLDRLGVDAVDLLLLHWPRFEATSLEATVELLHEARQQGWTRHVGVSNFSTELLARAWDASEVPLAVNQVEYHPFLGQDAILAALRERGMALTAYSPIAQGKVLDSSLLREIGERHDRSPVQISLRWLLQQEKVIAIPRTSSEEHCRQNFRLFDFELSAAEMERISGLARPDGRIVSPRGLAPEWDEPRSG